MFNGLFSSLFGKSKESNDLNSESENNQQQQSTDASDTKNIFSEENVRVILLDEDKDWLFVERENPEEDEDSFVADKQANNLQLVPFKSILSHLSAVRENDENCMLSANLPFLYPNTMDESWFLTPPSCFSSASIQLVASPLENLLIEHPSMSVYHNIRRRRSLTDVNRDELEDLVVLELSHDIDNKDAVSHNSTHSSLANSILEKKIDFCVNKFEHVFGGRCTFSQNYLYLLFMHTSRITRIFASNSSPRHVSFVCTLSYHFLFLFLSLTVCQ